MSPVTLADENNPGHWQDLPAHLPIHAISAMMIGDGLPRGRLWVHLIHQCDLLCQFGDQVVIEGGIHEVTDTQMLGTG